jgi:hypothetical protein
MILFSVALYIGLGIPISLLHETGHAYICASNGFDYRIWVDFTGGHLLCAGRLDDSFVYNAMGGLFGLAGSAALVIAYFATRHYAFLAVGLAYAVDQEAKILIEGMYSTIYNSGALDIYITALQVASWLGFMLYFARKSQVERKVGA